MMNEMLKRKILDKNIVDSFSKVETPAVIYNLDIVDFIISSFKKQIKSNLNFKLYYALKANPNPFIIKHLHALIDGVDVASIQEYRKIENVFLNSNISATGPSFESSDINEFFKKGLKFDFNSLTQLKNAAPLIKNSEIGIRVNIPYNFNGKQIESRFGIRLDDNDLFNIVNHYNLKINRIHVHNGEKDEVFLENYKKQLTKLKEKNLLKNLQEINLGGGFLDIFIKEKVGNFVSEIEKLHKEFFCKREINYIIEPGGALLSLSGVLITKVISIDSHKNKDDIIVNASAHNLFQWFKPRLISHTSKSQAKILTNIYGTSCYEGDFFFLEKCVKKLAVGELLVFFPVGSYSKSNHSNLHGFKYPKEYYFKNDKLI